MLKQDLSKLPLHEHLSLFYACKKGSKERTNIYLHGLRKFGLFYLEQINSINAQQLRGIKNYRFLLKHAVRVN